MNILITYFSLTGNTARIARAIYEQALTSGHNAALLEIRAVDAQNLRNYDLVFVGSAVHNSGLAEPVKQFLENITKPADYKLAGFVTHATQMPSQGERQRELYDRWAGHCLPTFFTACKDKGIPFLGYFNCQGKPSPGIADFIHNTIVTEDVEWNAYITEVMKHPDMQDIEDAKDFTQRVLTQCN